MYIFLVLCHWPLDAKLHLTTRCILPGSSANTTDSLPTNISGGNCMKNKVVFLGVVLFLILSTAGVNMLWLDQYQPQKKGAMLPENREQGKTSDVFNKKEGWGFVRSRDGQTPEITAHQWNMVRKYNALFVGDVTQKQVTITFDMGYEKEGLTPKILEVLKKNGIKAAFFVTTYWIEKNQDLAKQVVADGHLLGNHTVNHKSLPTLNDEKVREEILEWEEVALRVTGQRPKFKYMRPPMGEYSERTLKLTKELGYRTAFWSVAIRDWIPMGGPDEAVKGIIGQLHNGAVILLHGNSEDVAGGLEQIVARIKAKGYKIVPINEI